jgi:hypothetical protein
MEAIDQYDSFSLKKSNGVGSDSAISDDMVRDSHYFSIGMRDGKFFHGGEIFSSFQAALAYVKYLNNVRN